VQGFTPTSGPSTASSVVVGEAWGWTFANGWAWNSAMRYGTGFTDTSPEFFTNVGIGWQL